jgi:putative holliday junction resolvase
MMIARYLGVDLGTKRIGLAVGDSEGGIVSPVDVLDAQPTPEANARAILKAAAEYDANGIVIGLPLNMDGTEGPQTKLSKTLAAAIRKLVSASATVDSAAAIRVFLHDERLTSFAADKQLAGRDLTRKKKKARQDALAAAILLQSFLDANRTPKPSDE